MVKMKNKTVSVSQTAVNPLSLQQVPKQGLADTEKVQQTWDLYWLDELMVLVRSVALTFKRTWGL